MKFLVLSLALVSSFVLANDIVVQTGKNRGIGEEDASCWVKIKEVYPNGDIRVKSSYDSLFTSGYRLERKGAQYFELSEDDLVVEVRLDDEGNIEYYNRAIITDAIFTHIVANSWCKDFE